MRFNADGQMIAAALHSCRCNVAGREWLGPLCLLLRSVVDPLQRGS